MLRTLSFLPFILLTVLIGLGTATPGPNACLSADRGNCYCDLADGSGKAIDLHSLAVQSTSQPFSTSFNQISYVFVFCGSIPSDDLPNCYEQASSCAFSKTDVNGVDLGRFPSARYEMRTNTQHPTPSIALVMDSGPGTVARTVAFLKCDPQTPKWSWTSYGFQGETDPDGYQLYYMDFAADSLCLTNPIGPTAPGGLSVGSILCIVFFSLMAAYFIGGTLIMTFYFKREGRERIPNVDFWAILPSLAKEGLFFTWNTFKQLIGKH